MKKFKIAYLPLTKVNWSNLFIRGNPLKIKLDAGCDKMRQEIIGNGWEHHYTLCYGDQTGNLAALCKMLDIQYTIVK